MSIFNILYYDTRLDLSNRYDLHKLELWNAEVSEAADAVTAGKMRECASASSAECDQ